MCTKLLHNCKQKQVCQYSPVATCTVYCSYMYTVLTVGTVCCVHTHSSHHTLGMHPVHKVARDATDYYHQHRLLHQIERKMYYQKRITLKGVFLDGDCSQLGKGAGHHWVNML